MNSWLHTIDHDRLVALRRANSRFEEFLIRSLKDADRLKAVFPSSHMDISKDMIKLLRSAVRECQSYGRAISFIYKIETKLIGRIPHSPAELAGMISNIEFLCDTSDCSEELFISAI